MTSIECLSEIVRSRGLRRALDASVKIIHRLQDSLNFGTNKVFKTLVCPPIVDGKSTVPVTSEVLPFAKQADGLSQGLSAASHALASLIHAEPPYCLIAALLTACLMHKFLLLMVVFAARKNFDEIKIIYLLILLLA